jgi:16S rRNA (guanine966-N2)-methyltransferase
VTRIVGGSAGGRRLRTPPGDATRPTSDRVREALFSSVQSEVGSLVGLGFLDLFAGTGAVGLEARSRGASAVTLVERDRRTAALARKNAAALGMDDVEVKADQVARLLSRGPSRQYDVVFADPPYPMPADEVEQCLALLVAHGWLGPGALVVVERAARGPDLTWPPGLEGVRRRAYGETVLWYGHADSANRTDPSS